MYLRNIIDQAKIAAKIDTDTELAAATGCTKSVISRARHDGQCPTKLLVKIADISGIQLPALLLARELDSEKNQEVKAELERTFQSHFAGHLYYRKLVQQAGIFLNTCASIWNQTLTRYPSAKNYANLTPIPGKTLSTTP